MSQDKPVRAEHERKLPLRPRVLVMCSTFPRWPGDALPDFIERLTTKLGDDFRITLLAPHHAGARRVERWKNIVIVRYRYFLPTGLQQLAYGGGILPNIRNKPWLIIQVPLLVIAGALACRRLLSRHRYELVHAHWIIPQAMQLRLAAGKRRTAPRLVTSHGGDLWTFDGKFGRRLKQWALQGVANISVVSKAMKPVAANLAPGSTISVIPMGTETELFHPPARPAPLQRMLFAGRLSEKKGVEIAIRALALLPDLPDLHLTIAGDGPLQPHLRALVRELGLQERVTFAGWQDRDSLAEMFRTHGLFLFPSVIARGGDQEGLGLTVAEAMASGCAVIASALPAVNDLVIENETGMCFPPGDYHALAERVRVLQRDNALARQLAGNARQHVENHFSMARSVGEFHRLYLSAIEDRVVKR